MTQIQNEALKAILAERAKQDAKWGESNHSYYEWLAILTEEVGELSEAILRYHFAEPPTDPEEPGIYDEVTQVAAVALAILEQMERHALAIQTGRR